MDWIENRDRIPWPDTNSPDRPELARSISGATDPAEWPAGAVEQDDLSVRVVRDDDAVIGKECHIADSMQLSAGVSEHDHIRRGIERPCSGVQRFIIDGDRHTGDVTVPEDGLRRRLGLGAARKAEQERRQQRVRRLGMRLCGGGSILQAGQTFHETKDCT
ncbi:MAG: hypothetical protein WEF86_04310 [Gemmatimonadota bacterium]